MTAFVPYVTFMKHAKKVARPQLKRTRPILSTVLHKDDYVSVTDSHRMYIAKEVYGGEEKTLDAQTGLEVDHGEYPDVERLIEDEANAKFTFKVDALRAYEAIRAIEIAGRFNRASEFMELKVGQDLLKFKTDDKAEFVVSLLVSIPSNTTGVETVTFNIKYMKEAFHILKDAKVEEATISYFGNTRPIQIRAGNFTAIVLPIRTTQ